MRIQVIQKGNIQRSSGYARWVVTEDKGDLWVVRKTEMKPKNKGTRKYSRCLREYDRDEVARQYGKDSNVYLLGYCSAYCYTRDKVKEKEQ